MGLPFALFDSIAGRRRNGFPGRACRAALAMLALSAATFSLISGCGSGADRVSSTPTGAAAVNAEGKAQFAVIWPARTASRGRLIPFDSSAIQVVVTSTDGKRLLGSAIIARPNGGGNGSATVDKLPVGPVLVTATAYPNADATGVAQATATVPVTVVANTTVPVSLTMASTIAKVVVMPTTGTLTVGGTEALVATPVDASGSVVLVSTSTISWTSSNNSIAKVAATGMVTGIAAGTATITVTETESGVSGTSAVTVSGAPTPTPTPTVPPASTISFAAGVTYSCPGAGDVVLSADFDGDGNQDIVVQSNNSVLLFYGKGDGTLKTGVTIYSTNTVVDPQCIGDFNKDGKPDIVCSVNSDTMIVLMNQGDGTFKPVSINVGNPTSSAVAADFNGDGYQDIAIVVNPPYSYGGSIAILLNNGGTSFTPAKSLGIGAIPQGLAVGDLNSDGHQDLVATVTTDIVGQSGTNTFLGKGDGTFTNAPSYGTASFNVTEAFIADLNGDGKPDVAVNDFTDGNFAILFGKGDGTLQDPVRYTCSPAPNGCALSDMDGDTLLDLTIPTSNGRVSILRNQGAGTFATPLLFNSGISGVRALTTTDLNKDGRRDIVVVGGDTLSVLLNTSK